MSKTKLKKELAQFSQQQLVELILEMYDSRKEVKEYLTFFLNPDSKALFEKYQKLISRELSRGKYHRSKARISRIKEYMVKFESFAPDIEYRYLLYRWLIVQAMSAESLYSFSDTLFNGIDRLIVRGLDLASKNYQLDTFIANAQKLIEKVGCGSQYYRRRINELFATYISENGL